MKQVGLVLESRGVLREGMTVTVDGATGVITSGTFSPTLKLSIAIARVPAATGDVATVDLRGVATPVRVVKLPFVAQRRSRFTPAEAQRRVKTTHHTRPIPSPGHIHPPRFGRRAQSRYHVGWRAPRSGFLRRPALPGRQPNCLID